MNKIKFLIYCNHTISCGSRTGVQRVVLNIIQALSMQGKCELVKWDSLDGQLRYLDSEDLQNIFGGDSIPAGIQINLFSQRVNYRFGDVIDDPDSTWLIFPEIPFHTPNGNHIFSKLISQSREYGIRFATIFYDLIPLLDKNYDEYRGLHEEYLLELVRSDLIVPISYHASETLVNYYQEHLPNDDILSSIAQKIIPISLGQTHFNYPNNAVLIADDNPSKDRIKILLLGTIEPRKQQLRALRLITEIIDEHPNSPNIEVNVVGSLHPLCADEFNRLCKENDYICYHSYVDEKSLGHLISDSTFSIFASYLEGYGLPIVESIAAGVPCLTASFGSMAEIGSMGGCLLVDVIDDKDFKDGIWRLISEPKLITKLRNESLNAKLKTWEDYVIDLHNICLKHTHGDPVEIRSFVSTKAGVVDRDIKTAQSLVWFEAKGSKDVRKNSYMTGFPVANRKSGSRFIGVSVEVADLSFLTFSEFSAIADADVIGFISQDSLDNFLLQAQSKEINNLLSESIFVQSDISLRHQSIKSELQKKMLSGKINLQIAANEIAISKLSSAMIKRKAITLPTLEIVISTYNRSKFVELNVAWILNLIERHEGRVTLLVVDNASTDDTAAVLAKFHSKPYFKYISHAVNVGMLGNLRECSINASGDFVWMIGDDDYISPDAIERILSVVDKLPRLPLIYCNFGVYHRIIPSSEDSPHIFFNEMQFLAPNPSSDMETSVNKVVEEHDNLFTAIYPIVLRHDLASACFNYPFDGKPFSNLVESIPTSKLLLGSYRYAPCFWLAKPAIVGNVNNSWSKHRPRWHLVIMPILFQLARDAGVNSRILLHWAKVHWDLFIDSANIAIKSQIPAHIEVDKDIPRAEITFLRKITLPHEMEIEK